MKQDTPVAGICRPSRRELLQSGLTVGAGLVLGFRWSPRAAWAEPVSDLAPNAFVRIGRDSSVTVIAKHIEFGQGIYSGLATILADELDADWPQVRVEAAPSDATRYNNLFFGPVQGTGGSTGIANSWMQLRQAGATARALLAAAAADAWKVATSEIEIEAGVVRHSKSERKGAFGEFVERAAKLAIPTEVTLKKPEQFSLIGKGVARVDVPGKCEGSATFTMDIEAAGMLTALITHPPRFGGTVGRVDDKAARKIAGVVDVVTVPRGVAVIATSFWAAKKGRDALAIEWDESNAEKRSSEQLFAEYRSFLDQPGFPAKTVGEPAAAFAAAASTVEARYDYPYLAHAPMEPLDCVVQLTDERCDVWAGSQLQTVDQAVVAATVGLPAEKVAVHTQLAGGSFGRRATPDGDVAGEAASIARASGLSAPIKLIWTRENDIRGGRYRPMYVHRLRAAVDAGGRIAAWEHRIVGQSIVKGTPFAASLIHNGIDASILEGGIGVPYSVPNMLVDFHTTEVGVPVLWWRSVGHTHNAFSVETFIDELAERTGQDPVAMRRALLVEHPRHLAVLDRAAKEAGWESPAGEGRARGVAVHSSFGSFAAIVVEVTLGASGMPKVERAVCAADCGTVINPDNLAAQLEGGLGFGLGAALHDEITLDEGRVVQSNFHDYRSLRIGEMPRVEVHIIDSTQAPTGVGEISVPPIAPAVANAYAALTGTRIRALPFATHV